METNRSNDKKENKDAEAFENISGNTVETVDNRVYLYSDITFEASLQVEQALHELDAKLAARQIRYGLVDPIPIYLYVESYGGYLAAGTSIMDAVSKTRAPVIAVVSGVAASAATFCVVAADHRIIRPHAKMMVHQLRTGFWGKASDAEDFIKNTRANMETIKNVYLEHTSLPKEKLNDVLKHDIYWTAKQCVKYKLVDEIRSDV